MCGAAARHHVQSERLALGPIVVEVEAEVAVAIAVPVGLEGEAGVLVGGRERFRLAPAGLQRQPRVTELAAQADAGLARTPAPGADAVLGAVGTGLLGEHLDHAADRIGAVQAAAHAAQDLDALDLRQRQVLEGVGAGGRRVDAHAVDQQHDVTGVAAAQEDARHLAGPAGGADLDAAAGLQQLGQRHRAGVGDGVGIDDAQVGQHGIDRLRQPRGGDDHRLQRLRLGGQGGEGKGGRDEKAQAAQGGRATTGREHRMDSKQPASPQAALLAYAGGPRVAGGCAWQAGIRARGSMRQVSHRGHRLPTGVRPQWH